MKLKHIIKFAACALTIALLAACGGTNGNDDTPSGQNQQQNGTGAGYQPGETPEQTEELTSSPAGLSFDVEWEHNFQRVVLQEGNPEMLVNNEWLGMDNAPVIIDEMLWIPFSIAQLATGTGVVWQINGDGFTVANGDFNVTGAGERINGELFVPLYEIAEAINLRTLGWDARSNTLVVTTGTTVPTGRIPYREINNQREVWYGSPNSINIAVNLTYLQRTDGGWPRGIGQGGNAPHNPNDIASITPDQLALAYANRFANDAYFGRGITTHETRFMLRMYEATRIEEIGVSAMRGLGAILDAQIQNPDWEGRGGWPYYVTQRTAHRGGVSINDDSYTTIMELLWDIKNGEFPNVIDDELRAQAAQAFEDGLDALLRLQIPSTAFADGQERLTAWGQHMHPVTGEPMWAREFEPPSISGWESVDVLVFLMSLPNPCERLQYAIHSAVYFFAYVEIFGYSHITGQPSQIDPTWGNDRILVAREGARGLWGRFICVDTFNPMFSDRRNPDWRLGELTDAQGRIGQLQPSPGGTLRHIYNEDGTMDIIASYAGLSHERRNGYQYIGAYGANLPGQYRTWMNRNGLESPNQ